MSVVYSVMVGLPRWLSGRESAWHAGDVGLIPGSGRCPGEGNGSPLQYSWLGNPMDKGAWQATVHGVARVEHDWLSSRARMHTHTHTHARSHTYSVMAAVADEYTQLTSMRQVYVKHFWFPTPAPHSRLDRTPDSQCCSSGILLRSTFHSSLNWLCNYQGFSTSSCLLKVKTASGSFSDINPASGTQDPAHSRCSINIFKMSSWKLSPSLKKSSGAVFKILFLFLQPYRRKETSLRVCITFLTL